MNNTKLLKDYSTFLVKISKICQPVIVAGGGNIARHYISHARSSGADESTLDELGIEVSRLNAKLLIYALKNRAYPHPPTNLQEVKHAVDSGQIVIAGGLHPGQSTNGTAALIAEKVFASEFLNATEIPLMAFQANLDSISEAAFGICALLDVRHDGSLPGILGSLQQPAALRNKGLILR